VTQAPSTRLLLGLSALFLAAFWFQRCRSDVLAIEAEAPLARTVATQTGLTVAEVMALRELLGPTLPEAELVEQARRYRALDSELGAALAALAVAGHEALVRAEYAAAGGDPAAAWLRLKGQPEAIAAVRFRAMVKRFAARAAAR
jgi:hypothetical protein